MLKIERSNFVLLCIVVVLFVVAFYFSLPLINYSIPEEYYSLTKDVELYSSDNISFGKLSKGTIIKKTSYFDFFDVKNKINYKLIVLPKDSEEFLDNIKQTDNGYYQYEVK